MNNNNYTTNNTPYLSGVDTVKTGKYSFDHFMDKIKDEETDYFKCATFYEKSEEFVFSIFDIDNIKVKNKGKNNKGQVRNVFTFLAEIEGYCYCLSFETTAMDKLFYFLSFFRNKDIDLKDIKILARKKGKYWTFTRKLYKEDMENK